MLQQTVQRTRPAVMGEPKKINERVKRRTESKDVNSEPMARKAVPPSPSVAPSILRTTAFRLLTKVVGIYVCFLTWGLLQEKLSKRKYHHRDPLGPEEKWDFMITLNMAMSFAACFISTLIMAFQGTKRSAASIWVYTKPAFSNTIASPIGYLSLNFIPYPLMLLVKNAKLVPVMLVGRILNGTRYSTLEYLSVLLITSGVVTFMMKPSSSPQGTQLNVEGLGLWAAVQATLSSVAEGISVGELVGIGLALLNLLIDGYTNSAQDRIVAQYRGSPYELMQGVNIWSCVFAVAYLVGDLVWQQGGDKAELVRVFSFITNHPSVKRDLLAFALTNAVGQVFIFSTIQEFGSLTSVTITITRKMFSILLSICLYKHTMYWWMWVGLAIVFLGITVGVVAKQHKKKEKAH